ncbi:MAG TPA: helix-turn-helix domain-containing protein [Emticicia sp.]
MDDICLELAISRSQLFRFIKEQTNLSPSRFIWLKRLSKGKQLLEDTNLRIVEITSLIGFDSQQTFSKYFTEEFGVSPTDYRKTRENTTESIPENIPEIVEQIPVNPIERIEEPAPFRQETSRKISRKEYAYLALAILAVVLVVGFLWNMNSMPTGIMKWVENNSIAVLPIQSVDTTETSMTAEGLTEQIRTTLTSLENLKVISKNSSESFQYTNKTIPQIASELHVVYVLDGKITKTSQGIRVSLELIKAAEDQVVWAKQYDGKLTNTIDFISRITNEVSNELRKKLKGINTTASNVMPTQNLEAYQEYLKGRQLMLIRTKEKLEAGIERFGRALALDPDFTDALDYKTSAYRILGNSSFMDMEQSVRLAEQNALATLQKDAENGLAYAVLANTYRQ